MVTRVAGSGGYSGPETQFSLVNDPQIFDMVLLESHTPESENVGFSYVFPQLGKNFSHASKQVKARKPKQGDGSKNRGIVD